MLISSVGPACWSGKDGLVWVDPEMTARSWDLLPSGAGANHSAAPRLLPTDGQNSMWV
jgi:hypothetical protein